IVAIVSTTGTIVSMCMGSLVAKYIQAHLANIIGSSIIVGVGAWIILQSWINPSDNTAEPVCQETSGSAAPQSGAEKILEFHIKSLGIFVRILREPWRADVDFSKEIDGKEAFLLALALTINNLASGFGGGIVGINIPFTAVMVFVFSLLTLACSVKFGHKYLSRWLGKWAGVVSGLILIFVGVYEFFS
ncbi:MAG: manganese efflux pump, partial [Desulfofundulus sp.]